MKKYTAVLLLMLIAASVFGQPVQTITDKTAAEILGNPNFRAISYSGYRQNTRNIVPTQNEFIEDLKLLNAVGIKVLRTYDTQLFAHTATLLAAIRQLKNEDPNFEMYVMLGAWIECEGAWTAAPNHDAGNAATNTAEIARAIELVNQYPDIVKIIAVGNEAMVNWAAGYYVRPAVILGWVNYLQQAKKSGKIPADVWITSSDNFASWGGGGKEYHTKDLTALIKSVDYVSMHTYPFHDTHYNPAFWVDSLADSTLGNRALADAAMQRAADYAKSQYKSVADYLKKLGVEKPIHIGETGWASVSDGFYGQDGSGAADEYKQKCFYEHMSQWTDSAGMSCFFFEAFDEPWKDANNAAGSENHFGLFTVDGQAKYALWDWVDAGAFEGLSRGGNAIEKTFDGDEARVQKACLTPKNN